MKPRPPHDDDDAAGLDSLLDTMTNVVGILIMVLIATQLGVKDAVTRIAESGTVDPNAIAEAEEKLHLTSEQYELIAARLEDLKPKDDRAIDIELDDLRRRADQTRSQISDENERANRFAAKIADDEKKAASVREQEKKIAEEDAARDKLRTELTKSLEDEARLKAILDETPIPQAPPPKTTTLPDPRPAPEGTREVTFLCAGNKVYPIAADDWRETIRKRAEFLAKSKGLDGGPAIGVPPDRFLPEFKKANRSLRDDFFDIELYASGIYPRLRFIPRENGGAEIQEVIGAKSRFRRLLASLDRNQYYVRFIVLPDSFEAYLAARAVTDELQLLAGWDPQAADWQYTTHLGGSILFGPKPPPDPNAKPAPPAKPANVVD